MSNQLKMGGGSVDGVYVKDVMVSGKINEGGIVVRDPDSGISTVITIFNSYVDPIEVRISSSVSAISGTHNLQPYQALIIGVPYDKTLSTSVTLPNDQYTNMEIFKVDMGSGQGTMDSYYSSYVNIDWGNINDIPSALFRIY